MKKGNIIVIGTGYVGLTHGACLADLGNNVICVDIDEVKIAKLKEGLLPIYEPGLAEIVARGIKDQRLQFTTSFADILFTAEIVFIAVGTPSGKDGHADMQYVRQVATDIGKYLTKYTVIVTKSTVPVGTGDMVRELINLELKNRKLKIDFDVVSNPEFLKEGSAVEDFKQGDRIVIGCNNKDNKAFAILDDLYLPLRIKGTKILKTDLYSAEIIKYAANSLLAVEVSFINSISLLCEKVGADVIKVSKGLKLDSRIGAKAFLNPGPGFGGSCFPKDVLEFMQTFQDYGIPNGILESTISINEYQKLSIFQKVQKLLPNLNGKNIGVLGLAFKANTDDIRYASSIVLIDELLKSQTHIKVYDPQAMDNFKKFYPQLTYACNFYECIENVDCIVIMTDWDEFKQPNWQEIDKLVREKNMVDAKNLYNQVEVRALGFKYLGIGR